MRAIRTTFLFFGAVFALLLITIGVGGYLITGPVDRETGANPIVATSEAAQSLDHKIDALEQEIDAATARGEHRQVTLVITEEEATSKIDELAEAGDLALGMERVQIHFIDSQVYAFAKVDLIIDVQVALQAQIEANNGEVDITIESFKLGRLSIPKTLIDQVMRALTKLIEDRLDEEVDIELKQITIGNGQMIVTGVTK